MLIKSNEITIKLFSRFNLSIKRAIDLISLWNFQTKLKIRLIT